MSWEATLTVIVEVVTAVTVPRASLVWAALAVPAPATNPKKATVAVRITRRLIFCISLLRFLPLRAIYGHNGGKAMDERFALPDAQPSAQDDGAQWVDWGNLATPWRQACGASVPSSWISRRNGCSRTAGQSESSHNHSGCYA